MKQEFKFDFLDILRILNKRHIYSDPKDDFFKALMEYGNNVPDYLENLSEAYHIEFEKEYEDSPNKNFMLSNLFCNEIKRQLSDNLIEDKKNCLLITSHAAPYALTYVGSIKGMKKLFSTSYENAKHFDFFKKSVLQGLIARYCHNIVSGQNEDSERLNKLIVIYAEHIKNIAPQPKIPIIIDEEFISELFACKNQNNGILDPKDSYNAVHHLINRKFPINDKELSPYESRERRGLR